MAVNVRLFETEEEFESVYISEEYVEDWVSYTENTKKVKYNKTKYEKMLETPLTFEIESDGDIFWVSQSSGFTKTISYKKNDGDWIEITSTADENPPKISVVAGDKVQFKGNGGYYHSGLDKNVSFSGTTCQFSLCGNILSLNNSDEDVFPHMSAATNNWTFRGLFNDVTGLTDASMLRLTTGKANFGIYNGMFSGCTSLTTAPELPATTLEERCYNSMFDGCTSLTQAPELPVTTLASRCYANMFRDCTNLTTAPELPATTLANDCYNTMFKGCTSLTKAPELPATTLASACYKNMFSGCTSLTTAPSVLPATTLANNCYESMFYGCTSLTTAPELPATTLEVGCYNSMLFGCTSLITAPALPATTLADYCYYNMFEGCTSLTEAPELPATTLAERCYQNMFYGCTSLTESPELPATTLTQYCYQGMFYSCTSLTSAPELPATTLATSCYNSMFRYCYNLNYIKCLATDISANSSRWYWVGNVAENGVFIKDSTMTGWTRDVSGIPPKWLVIDNELTIIETPSIVNSEEKETFIIYSDTDWQVYECPNWIYLSITSGTDGLYNIEISASTNTTEDKRSGDIVFKTTDNQQEKTMSVTQLAPKETQPLTIIATSSGELVWMADHTGYSSTIQYRKNDGEWTTITSSRGSSAPRINLVKGDYVEFKGDNESYTQSSYSNFFSGNVAYNLYGNIMSMIDSTGFTTATTLTGNGNFKKFFYGGLVKKANMLVLPATTLANSCYNNMFYNCNRLTAASELPATTLAQYCYQDMFNRCGSLTTAPELPATTLAQSCYQDMFNRCTSLTEKPELPATTLAQSCYQSMFWGCTSLTTAPDLPAATLAINCYRDMFNGCTSLTEAPELPATTLAQACYQQMFYGCTSLTEAPELPATALSGANSCYSAMFRVCTLLTTTPELPATTLANNCYEYMFAGCTSLTTPPELPATTLANNCYYYMFSGCTSLTTTPELPATTMATSCYNHMFRGCASLTTAPELPATTLAQDCYANMFNGCTSLTTTPELPVTTLAYSCYNSMFYGCTSLTTAPALPATTLADKCYINMFNGCTSLTTAPDLPAVTLVSNCYYGMFNGCSELNSIKCLAENINASESTSAWVEGVASAGTFTMSNNGAPWTISINGIPEGWIIENESGGTFLFTNPQTFTIAYSGGQKTLGIISNTSWAITEYPNWCSFDNTTGTGIETLNLTFSENTGTTERAGNIIVQTTDSSCTYTVSVIQKSEGEGSRYLTFNIIGSGNLYWKANKASNTKTIEYRKNNGEWVQITSTTGGVQIAVAVGDVLEFRGNNAGYATGTTSTVDSYNCFSGTSQITIRGNIMSMVDSVNFSTLEVLTANYTFANFFRYCSNLTDASMLVLPATSLTEYCYVSMFKACKLTAAPELPATTLARGCYRSFLQQCTGITTAPDLLAPILVTECYQEMFDKASKINYIKCLATNVTGSTYTSNWVRSVASTGTFVKNSATTWSRGDSGIPTNWTVTDAE